MPSRRLGLLVLLALLELAGCGGIHPDGELRKARSLLLVTIDTCRADHLGCYGSKRAETPVLDSIASHGLLFENAVAVTPITLPAHTSILTGLYPTAHGVRDNGNFVVPDRVTTLAEVLSARGYRTAAFVSSYSLVRSLGLAQGFSVYDDRFLGEAPGAGPAAELVERRAPETTRAALPALAAEPGRPFFIWVHYFDPHYRYDPPSPWKERFADSPYDGEIACVDHSLGELLNGLDRTGRRGETLLVVIGDHGESLGEHGEPTHGRFLYDATVRIPFLIEPPGDRATGGSRLDDPVSQVDLVPTVLDLLEVPQPPGLQGMSLAPRISRAEGSAGTPTSPSAAGARRAGGLPTTAPSATGEARAVYSETFTSWLQFRWSPLRSLRMADLKYVEAPRPELYDLASDPGETRNLARERGEVVAWMRARLEAFVGQNTREERALAGQEADEETVRRLQSLGYTGAGERAGMGSAPASEPPRDGPVLRDPKDGIDLALRYDRAFALLLTGRPSEAAPLFASVAEEDPTNPYAHFEQAQALLASGETRAAIRPLERALALAPDLAPAWLARGQAASILGDPAKARECYDRALVLQPKSASAHAALGRLLDTEGDPRGAAVQFEACTALEPSRIDCREALLATLGGSGDTARALAAGRAFTEAVPGSARAWRALGSAALRSKAYPEATRAFHRAAEIDPADAASRSNLGSLAILAGRPEEAATEFREALGLDPALLDARLGLGHALLLEGKEQDADREFSAVLAARPGDSRVWSIRGTWLRETGREAEAVEAFRRALALNPEDAVAKRALGPTP